MPKETTTRFCELCNEPAALYCASDSAYLCRSCDSAVHSANFLVARHLRSALCTWCGDFDGEQFSGAAIRRCASSACKSCGRTSPIEDEETESIDEDEDVSSLSSACISTTESSTAGPATVKCSRDPDCCGEVTSVIRRKEARRCTVDARVEGVLVNWCKRLGLGGNNNQDDVVVATATRVLGVTTSLGRLAFVPVRVALAAAFWLGLRFCGDTCPDLKRVEKITGVPAKLILALEAKLERVLKTRRKITSQDDSKEGWAEC